LAPDFCDSESDIRLLAKAERADGERRLILIPEKLKRDVWNRVRSQSN
jgi:hypothetical protein